MKKKIKIEILVDFKEGGTDLDIEERIGGIISEIFFKLRTDKRGESNDYGDKNYPNTDILAKFETL